MRLQSWPRKVPNCQQSVLWIFQSLSVSELVVVGINEASHEASHLCKDILHISVTQPTASAPIQLVPVGAHLRKPKAQTSKAKSNDNDTSDSETDRGETDSEVEDESEDEGGIGTSANATIVECTASAAKDAARYSALGEEHDVLVAFLWRSWKIRRLRTAFPVHS
jgi:hypothetical protein